MMNREQSISTEKFRPLSHESPLGIRGVVKFYGRMILDLQILTIYLDVRSWLPLLQGKILDVGCGSSPYRFLLNHSSTEYVGIDIVDAEKFDYSNSSVIPFDGKKIPFAEEVFDGLICTEVLEHVVEYQQLVDECYRVLKKGGKGVITIPWSARYHYIPHDYFRYTPSALQYIFSQFSEVQIKPRGTDIHAVVSKIVVIFARQIYPMNPRLFLVFPLLMLFAPILFVALLIAYLSLFFHWGSKEDPLGYTVYLRK